jgi:hypothetical protein
MQNIFHLHISHLAMPRVTPRRLALRALTTATRRIRRLFIVQNVKELLNGDLTELNKHKDSFLALSTYELCLRNFRVTRYVTSRQHRSYSPWVYEPDLRKVEGEVPWLTDL